MNSRPGGAILNVLLFVVLLLGGVVVVLLSISPSLCQDLGPKFLCHSSVFFYLGISLAGTVLFAVDKLCARSGSRRIPEVFLLAAAALGAAPVMLLLSYLIRHKIRKQSFQRILVIFTFIHLYLQALAFSQI